MTKRLPEMIETAHDALKNAYAPYSNFRVSCCIQSENNELYTGVNFENCAYNLCTCAETAAIAHMIASGSKRIKDLVVMASSNQLTSPCGACRQQILEFSTSDTTIHLCDQTNVLKTLTIDELIPYAFHIDPPSRKQND